MSAYTVYQELFPPQTVEQVETSHFTSPDAINLVVAKASLLQIYEFVEYVPEQVDVEEDEQDEKLGDQELANERLNENEDMVKNMIEKEAKTNKNRLNRSSLDTYFSKNETYK